MPTVITFGEALVDLTALERGVSLAEASAFNKAAGGAPANVAVGLSLLGVRAGFIGKVGDDPFGHFLAETLRGHGVDTAGLLFSREARTGLAFISLQEDGERDFSFYRHPSADIFYRPGEVDPGLLADARIFHFGSLSLSREPAAGSTWRWLETAREHGLTISLDPNLRLDLWPDRETARADILRAAGQADWIKLSLEELGFLAGEELDWQDPDRVRRAARKLNPPNSALLVVSLGRSGCLALTPEFELNVPGFEVKAVDTTGAGDAFTAGLLAELALDPGILTDPGLLESALRTANAAGALASTGYGVIPSLPTRQEVESLRSG